jgi:hypothetical protein
MRRILHIIFWLALVLWVAVVVAPAIAAISAFTVLPEKGASIAQYQAYFAEDPAGMGRMVAGFVTDPIFIATDAIQWVLAPLVLLLAILEWQPLRMSRGPGNWIRLLTLVAATALVAYHNGIVAPRMAENLAEYRAAAAQDDSNTATRSMEGFDADHHVAEALFGIRLLLLLCAVVATAGAAPIAFGTTETDE